MTDHPQLFLKQLILVTGSGILRICRWVALYFGVKFSDQTAKTSRILKAVKVLTAVTSFSFEFADWLPAATDERQLVTGWATKALNPLLA